MPAQRFGRFEVAAELGECEWGVIYKATDIKDGRTVILRTVRTDIKDPEGRVYLQRFQRDAKAASALQSPNIIAIYGGGESNGVFFVVMECAQGMSLHDMLAQGRPLPMGDVQDISRQVCSGLDHAHSRAIVHPNLTPANIMVEWDGTVKILDFGVPAPTRPKCGFYDSPEQLYGRPLDPRSNLYSWGAMLYHMCTGQPPFASEDPRELKRMILEEMPTQPHWVNGKLHAGIDHVIFRAMAKSPAERYPRGADLVADLENHKNLAPPLSQPEEVKHPTGPIPENPPSPSRLDLASIVPQARSVADLESAPVAQSRSTVMLDSLPAAISAIHDEPQLETFPSAASRQPGPDTGLSDRAAAVAAAIAEIHAPAPAPAIARTQVIPAPVAAAAVEPQTESRPAAKAPREKIASALKKIPPASPAPMYGVFAAVLLLCVIAGAVVATGHSQPHSARPAPAAGPVQSDVQLPPPAQNNDDNIPTYTLDPEPTAQKTARRQKVGADTPAAPVITSGDLIINSAPEGAQVTIDGHTSPEWVTPYTAPGLNEGHHTVSLTKPGFVNETRAVQIIAGNQVSLNLPLTELKATAAISSDPPGAEILIDGKESGKLTPAQFFLDKGVHLIVVRKPGYFENETSAQLTPGQNFNFNPSLKVMGNVDDVRTAGKLKKVFGGAGKDMGSVSIKSSPKGARIVINGRMMDKTSPVEYILEPGNYEVTLTADGYKPLKRMITVEKGTRVLIDESMQK